MGHPGKIKFSYLTLPYLTLPYLTLPYLTLPYLTLPYLTLPYLTLPYLPFLKIPACFYNSTMHSHAFFFIIIFLALYIPDALNLKESRPYLQLEANVCTKTKATVEDPNNTFIIFFCEPQTAYTTKKVQQMHVIHTSATNV